MVAGSGGSSSYRVRNRVKNNKIASSIVATGMLTALAILFQQTLLGNPVDHIGTKGIGATSTTHRFCPTLPILTTVHRPPS